MSEIIVMNKMPVLALRGMTVFPEQTVHFDVGRIKSALALDQAMKTVSQYADSAEKHSPLDSKYRHSGENLD